RDHRCGAWHVRDEGDLAEEVAGLHRVDLRPVPHDVDLAVEQDEELAAPLALADEGLVLGQVDLVREGGDLAELFLRATGEERYGADQRDLVVLADAPSESHACESNLRNPVRPRRRNTAVGFSRKGERFVLLRIPLVATVLAAAAAAALLLPGAAVRRSAQKELHATVGPGSNISLTNAEGRVTHLDAGSYTIKVSDQSPEHNFHLTGPGVDRATDVDTTGTTTWNVTLTDGTFRYLCDAHPTQMKGSF